MTAGDQGDDGVAAHGHPEHVEATLARLAQADRAPLTVVASQRLCLHLEERADPKSVFGPSAVRAGVRRR